MRLHIEPAFGDRRARNVSASAVLEWMQGLEATHSASTVKRALQLLRGALDIAVEDGAIGRIFVMPSKYPRVDEIIVH